jgi:cytochrome c peroxidase
MKRLLVLSVLLCIAFTFQQCSKKEDSITNTTVAYAAIKATFGTNIDLENLKNYEGQIIPAYITKDNTTTNPINNAKATIGRVLFYDKKLSIDNTIACASCHQQQFAFGDTSLASNGVSSGKTGRHSMRLVNARFSREAKFFWDERAATLEAQTTKPIQDHAEMGYSGIDGRPDISVLLTKLTSTAYYNELFQFVYGNAEITEAKMQECLSQFIRSIQSFDSKFDIGRAQVANNNQNFPNYTAQENIGKNLFIAAPVFDGTGTRTAGGLGCNGCHNAPEFDIDPNSRNNGIVGVLNATGLDLTNTRAPSLRDLAGPGGEPNGPMMHTGILKTLQQAIGHYGNIIIAPGNTNLDPRLRPNGNPQKLNLNAQEVNSVIAFLKTLTGSEIYTDAKWSDPFL